MDDQLVQALKEVCSGNESAALVTIIKVQGSTPRKPGTKMVVTRDGQIFGTIGGGCGEAQVRQQALSVLDSLSPTKYQVNMTQELAATEGMVCGGVMEVLIEILPPGQNKEKSFMLQYLQALEQKEAPLLLTALATSPTLQISCKAFTTSVEGNATMLGKCTSEVIELLQKHDKATIATYIEEQEQQFFLEPAPREVDLVILGGGHIALPLSMMAKQLGYQLTVVDDRPTFANTQRFSHADQVLCADFGTAIESLTFSQHSYIVIVTRGHRHDKQCLQAVLAKEVGYLGMIGSKRRVKALLAEMLEEGCDQEALAKVHSPIGLDIGAQTPAEIAISILAEIISVHRKRGQHNAKN